MLFLLNFTVIKTQLGLALPPGLESLARLPPVQVLNAGCELYAKHPRLEVDQPDMARWYATLLLHKFPTASGALFYLNGASYAGRLAEVPLPEMVRFWTLQRDGVDIAPEVASYIWSAPRMVA